jgi:hypothetical protein
MTRYSTVHVRSPEPVTELTRPRRPTSRTHHFSSNHHLLTSLSSPHVTSHCSHSRYDAGLTAQTKTQTSIQGRTGATEPCRLQRGVARPSCARARCVRGTRTMAHHKRYRHRGRRGGGVRVVHRSAAGAGRTQPPSVHGTPPLRADECALSSSPSSGLQSLFCNVM